MKYSYLLMLGVVLFWHFSTTAQMTHRAISFHHHQVDFELVATAKKLGFNTVELQTEGGTLIPLKKLRQYADEERLFPKLDSLGMQTSLWVHELEDYQEEWGEVAVGNDRLWQAIAEKYDYILEDLLPEIDHLVLTIVESEKRVTESEVLKKLIETIHSAASKAQKILMVRTFVWDPYEMERVAKILSDLPKDVIIHTKYVPQDWHLRSVHHPLLGKVGDHKQLVELDLAGEYFKLRYVANCFTEELADRFKHWQSQGINGIVVRVNRLTRTSHNSIHGELMEANLWALGYWMMGKDEDSAWRDYIRHRFGAQVNVDSLKMALKPTGKVVAEALCVGRETFGDTRQAVPAYLTMNPEIMFPKEAKDSRYMTYYKKMANNNPPPLDDWTAAYENEEDYFFRSPFFRNWSVWIWDSTYRADYHKIRKGHPAVIEEKERSYQSYLDTINHSLEIIDALQQNLKKADYIFIRWKLEETKFLLQSMCEMQLAWLKMSNALYYSSDEDEQLVAQQHLQQLEQLAKQQQHKLDLSDSESSDVLYRGAYVDIVGYLEHFKQYWKVE